MLRLFIANSVKDLILGDIYEHLPITKIPLDGNVIGLGTTSLFDNGELVFAWKPSQPQTTICHCRAETSEIVALSPDSELTHFPYVCYTDNATAAEREIQVEGLTQGRLKAVIEQGLQQVDPGFSYYGIRMRVRWRLLLISVASKLCFWQTHKFSGQQGEGLYQQLTQYCFAKADPGSSRAKWLGDHLEWDLCGFYTRIPEHGLVTMPDPNNHLHVHGYSSDRRFGGHILDALSELDQVISFQVYPISQVHLLESNLLIKNAEIESGTLRFEIHNQGEMDTENVDVDVVLNNEYNSRSWQRIPLLPAGSSTRLEFPLPDRRGVTIQIIIDPNNTILEAKEGDNILTFNYP